MSTKKFTIGSYVLRRPGGGSKKCWYVSSEDAILTITSLSDAKLAKEIVEAHSDGSSETARVLTILDNVIEQLEKGTTPPEEPIHSAEIVTPSVCLRPSAPDSKMIISQPQNRLSELRKKADEMVNVTLKKKFLDDVYAKCDVALRRDGTRGYSFEVRDHKEYNLKKEWLESEGFTVKITSVYDRDADANVYFFDISY